MSKQISNKDLANLRQAYSALGTSIEEFRAGNYEMGAINFAITQSLLSSIQGLSLEDEAEPTTKKVAPRRSGIQDPEPKAPEPPVSNEAAGYIPPALLRTPSNAEIYAHTMDRVDQNTHR